MPNTLNSEINAYKLELTNKFNDLMHKKGRLQTEFSQSSGLASATVKQLMHGAYNIPRLDTLLHACVELGVTIHELLPPMDKLMKLSQKG